MDMFYAYAILKEKPTIEFHRFIMARDFDHAHKLWTNAYSTLHKYHICIVRIPRRRPREGFIDWGSSWSEGYATSKHYPPLEK